MVEFDPAAWFRAVSELAWLVSRLAAFAVVVGSDCHLDSEAGRNPEADTNSAADSHPVAVDMATAKVAADRRFAEDTAARRMPAAAEAYMKA